MVPNKLIKLLLLIILEADWTTEKHPLEGLYSKTIKHTGLDHKKSMAFVTFKYSEVNNKIFLKGVFPVVQKVDNAIRRINLYPADSAIALPKTYPLDSDLFSG